MQIFEIETILNLNQSGFTNRAIAKYLRYHHQTISYHLNKYNFKSSWANEPINIISKTLAKCSKCLKIKNISEFQYGRKGQKYQYKFSYCNNCRKRQGYLNLNSSTNNLLTITCCSVAKTISNTSSGKWN